MYRYNNIIYVLYPAWRYSDQRVREMPVPRKRAALRLERLLHRRWSYIFADDIHHPLH